MISERQILHLLAECEMAVGKPLKALRDNLLRHEKAFSHIWELIALYSVLSLGKVEPESGAGVPDICLHGRSCPPIWIEASYIYPRHGKQIRDLADFPRWIRDALGTAGVGSADLVNIDMTVSDPSKDLVVPKENERKELTRHPSWNSFVEAARGSRLKGMSWMCPLGNVAVSLNGISRFPRTTYPAGRSPETVKAHPVYRKIREKAQQAAIWRQSGKNYDPLILCFGASEEISQIQSYTWSPISLKKAVDAALLDTSILSLGQALNATGSLPNVRLRVPGSKYISAVIVVTIEHKYEPLGFKQNRRHAKAILFLNPHAEVTLRSEQEDLLRRIDFNSIEYGPGWEAWDTNNLLGPSTNTVLDRQRRRWGTMSINSCSDGSFELAVPTVVLSRIISGYISASEAWAGYGGDTLGLIAGALGKGQEIIDCKFIPSDPNSREENQVSLRFGPPKPPVICDKKMNDQ